ncbi:unnamed protein product [Blepharisma stoltei]|uniref:Uncharacterized protein n=1 Tax=Blepharisma stoltei TaxID=1481888 RepID=A0AAU9JAD3_9CILI|nr:unnamed protein product [Blepharisma stoltei]
MAGEVPEMKHGKWSPEEDEALRAAVNYYGEKQWRLIADHVEGRTPIQCLHRWSKILKPGLVKGPWSAQEDKQLREWIEKEGPTGWSNCAQRIPGRSGKQCRERWFNILNPAVKKGNWTAEDDGKIFQMYKLYGPKWTLIAKSLPGRTENSIKNRFYSTTRKMKSQEATQIPKEIKAEAPSEPEVKMMSLLQQVNQLETLLHSTRNEILNLETSLKKEDNQNIEGLGAFLQGLPPIRELKEI